MENEQVETMKTNKNLWGPCVTPGPQDPLTLSKSEGPGGPTSRVIGSFIGYGYSGFLFWNWTHASC